MHGGHIWEGVQPLLSRYQDSQSSIPFPSLSYFHSQTEDWLQVGSRVKHTPPLLLSFPLQYPLSLSSIPTRVQITSTQLYLTKANPQIPHTNRNKTRPMRPCVEHGELDWVSLPDAGERSGLFTVKASDCGNYRSFTGRR
jgi:hypothetical protein